MKKVFTPTLILAGLFAAGTAVADTPYAYWDASRTTDVAIADSFNRTSSSAYSEDNDVAVDIRSRNSVQEDNDYSSIYRTSEDNDYSSVYSSSEDNDVSEDNDITKIVDFQISTPTLTGYKYQDQQAGHQADQSVLGAARGHEVGCEAGITS